MKKELLLCFYLSLGILSFAQNTTDPNSPEFKQRFKEMFEEEFGKDTLSENKTEQTSFQSFTASVTLPQWFTGLGELYPNQNVSIGISDPGLDSTRSYNQAVIRALALAAFSQECKVGTLIEFYTEHIENLGEMEVFTAISNFKTKQTLGFQVLESFYTSNFEMIVLLAIDNNAIDSYEIETHLKFFQMETGDILSSSLSLDIQAGNQDGKTLNSFWILDEDHKSFDILSQWNGAALDLLFAKFKYEAPGSAKLDMENHNYIYSLKQGLWVGYLKALTSEIDQIEIYETNVKVMDDNFDNMYQDMTVVTSSGKISFDLSEIKIHSNNISISLQANSPLEDH